MAPTRWVQCGVLSVVPHEEERLKEAQRLLDKVRLGYAAFCTVVLVAFRETFGTSKLVAFVLACSGLLYSVLRLLKPSPGRPGRLPPLADWLDWAFIASLVFSTGGIKSCFHASYALPISGGALRYGLFGGLVGLLISLCIAGASYFLVPQGPSLPARLHVSCGIATMGFLVFIVGVISEKEKALRGRLYRASVTDPLTGLYNSAYLRMRASEEVFRFRRDGQPFSIAFLDLDFFKRVNDSHGHLFGDEVLRHAAALVKGSVRESDVPSRYGGDEFVILLPGCGRDAAESVLERVRLSFASPLLVRGKRISLSVSGGVACFPEDGEDLDALLSCADRRMYESKGGGAR